MKRKKYKLLVLSTLLVANLFACNNSKNHVSASTPSSNGTSEAPSSEISNISSESSSLSNQSSEAISSNVSSEVSSNVSSNVSSSASIKDDYECITIEEAIALAKEAGSSGTSKKYYVYGTIKAITNTIYGEMIISDGTKELSIYGTYSSDGAKRYSELDEKPVAGDEIVLYGVLKTYNDNVEMGSGWIQAFVHHETNVDEKEYTAKSIAEAREDKEGVKVKLTGVVARITFANGYVPNGFYLVDNTGSIYVYDSQIAAQVAIGNNVTIAGEKTYFILETEKSNAEKFGYNGCCQIQNVLLVSNDKGTNEYDKSWIQEATVKQIIETSPSENITTNIYKVNALITKKENPGFVNYYINDIDGTTGSYVYTSCNGGDFSWLDEFDGKICTVYLSPINMKSSASGCIFRFLPISVSYDNYSFNLDDAPDYALEYHAIDQMKKLYYTDPAQELLTSVSSELLGIDNITLDYKSSDETVVYFEKTNGKIIMHTGAVGNATITITATDGTNSSNATVNIEVAEDIAANAVNVNEAISSNDGDVVIVKGIVGGSLTNQTGFYIIDETGAIAVRTNSETLSDISLGDEVIISGTRSHVKKSTTAAEINGQSCLDNATVIANYYGNHEVSRASFDSTKTLADLYSMSPNEEHTTQIYTIKATVNYIETNYYTTVSLISGDTSLALYCSSGSQYSWLREFANKEVTLDVALVNWNDKTYYRGYVLSATLDGVTLHNTLNFKK